MTIKNLVFVLAIVVSASACAANSSESTSSTKSTNPVLKEVGSRGWFTTVGPFAEFDPNSQFVEIWTPSEPEKAPVMVYAHGGAGYREDDRARVLMFRDIGFATISFDSYEMNGFDDWNFVTRKIVNGGKQNMIWGVFKGAVEYATNHDGWDNQNIFFYGASNGARVVLHGATELANFSVRGIIAEAPAANGYSIGDIDIPTMIAFGKKDNWAGRSETDYVWTRTYPSSPLSLEELVRSLQKKGSPIELIFYENAGHSFHEGPLMEVIRGRANGLTFTAYEGADEESRAKYERDISEFVSENVE